MPNTSSGYSPHRPKMSSSGHRNARDEYLENAVRAASPARIRLMLIDRAIEVCNVLAIKYRESDCLKGPNEQSIQLLDILGELLGGVANNKNDLCVQVSDLYVFLCQELVRAESTADADKIESIRDVLRIDSETWRAVCASEQPAAILSAVDGLSQTVTAGLNLQG